MIAIRKFIGACLENVNCNSNNLEAVVGGMGDINMSNEAIIRAEGGLEKSARELQELETVVKVVHKEISTMHTRA